MIFFTPQRALFCSGIAVFLLTTAGRAYTGEVGSKESFAAATPAFSFEFGPRYWLSTGKYQKNLYLSSRLESRLTYSHLKGNTAEGFWQLKHRDDFFLKGYFGGGSVYSGQLDDEDFPPYPLTSYSSTIFSQKTGSNNYFSIDLGHNLFTNENGQLGAFIGYHYWMERFNTFGCQQIAGNAGECGSIPPEFGPVPSFINGINNVATWNSLRLGLNGDLRLGNMFHIMADIAYSHTSLTANDFHNYRETIRGIPEDGMGNGVQIDTIVNWSASQNLTLGVGGRWWYVATNGFTHFEQTVFSGQPQPIHVTQERYGLLVQANYVFPTSPGLEKEPITDTVDWPGLYIGPSIGYGTRTNILYMNATSPVSQYLQFLNTSPLSLNVQDAGFIGGAQAGYNWQRHSILLGIEGDFNYASIGGANATTSPYDITTSVNNNIRWIATLRGRLGQLTTDNMLLYLTAGAALGRLNTTYAQQQIGITCPYNVMCTYGAETQTKPGWTSGAGMEYAISKQATLKAEYLYVALNRISFNALGNGTLGTVNYKITSSVNSNIVRLGLNYKV